MSEKSLKSPTQSNYKIKTKHLIIKSCVSFCCLCIGHISCFAPSQQPFMLLPLVKQLGVCQLTACQGVTPCLLLSLRQGPAHNCTKHYFWMKKWVRTACKFCFPLLINLLVNFRNTWLVTKPPICPNIVRNATMSPVTLVTSQIYYIYI